MGGLHQDNLLSWRQERPLRIAVRGHQPQSSPRRRQRPLWQVHTGQLPSLPTTAVVLKALLTSHCLPLTNIPLPEPVTYRGPYHLLGRQTQNGRNLRRPLKTPRLSLVLGKMMCGQHGQRRLEPAPELRTGLSVCQKPAEWLEASLGSGEWDSEPDLRAGIKSPQLRPTWTFS